MRRSTLLLSLLFVWVTQALAAESVLFDAKGTNLHYVIAGSGETVVLLHGFSGSANGLYIQPGTFDALVDAGYQVVALDQVGHGKSGKPYDPDRYGMQMVEDIRRLMKQLDVDKIHLAGYSMGAKVANTFRSKYPDRLHTIILGGYGWPWRSREMSYAEALEGMTRRTVLPGNDIKALAAVSMTMHKLTPTEDNLRANSVPAFGIIGDKDAVVSAADFATFSATMAELQVITIPGTHAGPDGAPYKPRYAQEIIRFLAAYRAPGAYGQR
ncbi:MAG: alpha/beta fold hydrolase [Woeseiaceae bacterium]